MKRGAPLPVRSIREGFLVAFFSDLVFIKQPIKEVVEESESFHSGLCETQLMKPARVPEFFFSPDFSPAKTCVMDSFTASILDTAQLHVPLSHLSHIAEDFLAKNYHFPELIIFCCLAQQHKLISFLKYCFHKEIKCLLTQKGSCMHVGEHTAQSRAEVCVPCCHCLSSGRNIRLLYARLPTGQEEHIQALPVIRILVRLKLIKLTTKLKIY
uniref:uncharacterized protein LOC108593190 isoform X2 n=1 Tax=Callithrix jacchus TaxID=9483 RepID=UPI00083FF24F|nr:uncharacterized protein LOC108593190 isoform X2 [Callithrix jacchus]